MPMVVQNAASLAYRKAITKTRETLVEGHDNPVWLVHFANKLPDDDSDSAPSSLFESGHHRKERKFSKSNNLYFKLAWFIHTRITSKDWFEFFILLNIILVGVITGIDLENDGRDEWTIELSKITSIFTLVVFTLECILKIITEGDEPWNYFTDRVDGNFNCFDFFLVVMSFAFIDQGESAISGLRILRLARMVTFVKDVQQLRIIFAGLIDGMKSVVYIVMLLCLVTYIFSILGCILFGENDPVHFGTVAIAMVSLFQVSTLASWTSIAYVSWFGCEHYLGSSYSSDNASRISTMAGQFVGYQCTQDSAAPVSTGLFFASYILLTAWVIMSLFIGVITIGMFEAYLALKDEQSAADYVNQLTFNSMKEADGEASGKTTLKEVIDIALGDEISAHRNSKYYQFVELCFKIRDSSAFTHVITATIVLVGIVIGLDTDFNIHCERIEFKVDSRDDDDRYSSQDYDCKHPPIYFAVVTILAQTVFTFEAAVKILSEGKKPMNYFTHPEDGAWNCLDFFIVVAGFLELTPAKFVFEAFPVVLLRLLRLLRVFRLAKALPRLRSIVEALISGFSSVGWICLLIFVFNYISACMCMMIFKSNDPFHFGSLARAMFTVLRIETLDSWDQILYIAMFGCKGYPGGYDFLAGHENSNCESSKAFGGVGALVLILVTILGAYILPTVLIGIVSIKFDHSSKMFEVRREEKAAMLKHLEEAKRNLPTFFSHERTAAIVKVFRTLNSGGQHTLDQAEISPFFHYAVDLLFQVQLEPSQCETLFYLLDSSKSTEIGLGEFITFISILKDMHIQSKSNPQFATEFFGADALVTTRDKTIWDAAMDRVHAQTFENTWSSVLISINGVPGSSLEEKVKNLFSNFDSDGTGNIDAEELGMGLQSCGVLLNDSQLTFFFNSIDTNNSGDITIQDFVTQIERVKYERKLKKEEETEKELGFLQKRLKRSLSHQKDPKSPASIRENFGTPLKYNSSGPQGGHIELSPMIRKGSSSEESADAIKMAKLERENAALRLKVTELEAFKKNAEESSTLDNFYTSSK